jgi:hypothetical protein
MTLIEEIEELLIKVAYRPRVQRQHRVRGVARSKNRQYYRRNRAKIRKRMKMYRKRFRNLLKARKHRPSYKRVG